MVTGFDLDGEPQSMQSLCYRSNNAKIATRSQQLVPDRGDSVISTSLGRRNLGICIVATVFCSGVHLRRGGKIHRKPKQTKKHAFAAFRSSRRRFQTNEQPENVNVCASMAMWWPRLKSQPCVVKMGQMLRLGVSNKSVSWVTERGVRSTKTEGKSDRH